jgi:hypothetical protein
MHKNLKNCKSVDIRSNIKTKRHSFGCKSLEETELEKLNKSVEKAKRRKSPDHNKCKEEIKDINIKAESKCINLSVIKEKSGKKKINLKPIKLVEKSYLPSTFIINKPPHRNSSVNFDVQSILLKHLRNTSSDSRYKNNSMYNIKKVKFINFSHQII